VILPKLRDGYIVPDANIGRELALENPDAFFLSQSGECFHNVTVTGGKQRTEGPLSMKRELRDVLRLLADIESSLRSEETHVLTLGREIKELTSLLDRLEGEKLEAEKQAMTSGHLLQQLDSELGRVSERIRIAQAELRRLASERAEQQALITARQAELAILQDRRSELERRATTAQERLSTLRERRDLSARTVSERMASAATLEERHRAAASVLDRIESLVGEMRQRVDAIHVQIESSANEKLQREAENLTLANQLIEFEAERNATETRDSLLQFESEQVRARLAEIDIAVRESRTQLDAARDRRAELSAAAAKLQSDLQYMAETCLNELGIQ